MAFSGDERGGVVRVRGREYGWPGESAARRREWRRGKGRLWLPGLPLTAGVCPSLPKSAAHAEPDGGSGAGVRRA